MISPCLGILLVCLLMAFLFGGLKLIESTMHLHPELIRKFLHVGMGLAVLTFPWVFQSAWPVVSLAGASALFLLTMKFVPQLRDGIGTVLNAVQRPSLGEICFPLSVAGLIVLCGGEKLLYAVPILIMTLADAIAALVGIGYGKVRYVTTDGFKSVEGSLAFFSVAFLSVHIPLLLFTDIGRTQTLLIATLIGILSMLIEAMAARGLDNLLIPLGAFAFLRLYEHATIHALSIRLIAAIVLVIFVLCWRRRSTLDDSALIASALFGYGAAMLGGMPWVVGPLLLFLVHAAIWPRLGQSREHTVYAVASVTLGGLLWLILQAAYGGTDRFFIPYSVGFGAHLAIIGVSRIAVDPSSQPASARFIYSVLAGWGVTAVQLVPFVARCTETISAGRISSLLIFGLGGVVLAAGTFYRLLPYLYGPKGSDAAIHFRGFSTALAGSLLAYVLRGMIIGWR